MHNDDLSQFPNDLELAQRSLVFEDDLKFQYVLMVDEKSPSKRLGEYGDIMIFGLFCLIFWRWWR